MPIYCARSKNPYKKEKQIVEMLMDLIGNNTQNVSKPGEITVYHGTSVQSADRIIREGILKKYSHWKPNRVFVTTKPESTFLFGGITDALAFNRTKETIGWGDTLCYTQVAIFEINLPKDELHQDRNLEFRRWRNPHMFYVKRDIFPREIVRLVGVFKYPLIISADL